jgi:4'-phosphopantetheinyl transferase EntD
LLLKGLLPERVSAVDGKIEAASGDLFPEEAASIRSAVPKRQREFLAGRVFARRALAAAGFPACSLPSKLDRTPAWPPGTVGSITHSDRYCGAAVAPSREIAAIGIDIEETSRFEAEFLRFICTPAEYEALEPLPSERRRVLGTVVFSAKESFFKCQYTLTGALFGFMAVEIQLDEPAGEFAVRPCGGSDVLARFRRTRGRFLARDGVVSTAIALSATRLS